jgi:hypothetical protein
VRQVLKSLHLKTYDDLPFEYTELILCRDVYHCLPSELGDESWETISAHLALMKAEERTRK